MLELYCKDLSFSLERNVDEARLPSKRVHHFHFFIFLLTSRDHLIILDHEKRFQSGAERASGRSQVYCSMSSNVQYVVQG